MVSHAALVYNLCCPPNNQPGEQNIVFSTYSSDYFSEDKLLFVSKFSRSGKTGYIPNPPLQIEFTAARIRLALGGSSSRLLANSGASTPHRLGHHEAGQEFANTGADSDGLDVSKGR